METMDPPIFPEVVAQHTGIPLRRPNRIADNEVVRQIADQMATTSPVRPWENDEGERIFPLMSFSPGEPLQGESRMPTGQIVTSPITNPFLLRDVENIHRQQQINMQRYEKRRTRRRDGKGKGPNSDAQRSVIESLNATNRYEGTDEYVVSVFNLLNLMNGAQGWCATTFTTNRAYRVMLKEQMDP